MENPQIRPGLVEPRGSMPRVIAFFRNSAEANLAIQLLVAMGLPSDRIGITPPEQIEHEQGMLLSIGCPVDTLIPAVCADLSGSDGAEVHRQRR